jgi:hypothetical protein
VIRDGRLEGIITGKDVASWLGRVQALRQT